MKMPLSLPPTSVMSFSRLSLCSDSSCTGFREELILEKEDRDGRNGLHTDMFIRRADMTVILARVSVLVSVLYLSRESFLKILLTCSRSYVSIPSD